MYRQQSAVAPDAPSSGVDASKIPVLEPACQTSAKSADTACNQSVHKPQSRSGGTAKPQRTLTDAEVLKVLESRRAHTTSANDRKPIDSDVAILAPEDTNTRLALRRAVARKAPVCFAVQLQWSVQSIDVKSIPAHPIFKAYALYTAEGRRAGRTWFFLRLGFFSDAVSAKQVAHYLRGDFGSAAVVPVSPEERQQVAQMGRCIQAGTIARRPG